MIFGTLIAAAMAVQGGIATKTLPAPPITVTPVAPPPVIVPIAPPAPPAPMPIISSGDFAGVYNRPTESIHVRTTAGNAILFDDRLRVGRAGATFSQNRSEATEPGCASVYPQSVRNSLTLSVQADGPTKDHYRVSVSWTRPNGGCDAQGNRGISLNQAVELKPGRTVTIEGDAGVRVQLTRGR